eukprot:496033-Amphidinium_carterae.1
MKWSATLVSSGSLGSGALSKASKQDNQRDPPHPNLRKLFCRGLNTQQDCTNLQGRAPLVLCTLLYDTIHTLSTPNTLGRKSFNTSKQILPSLSMFG